MKFTVEGEKIIDELLQQDRFILHSLYGLPEWADARDRLPEFFTPVNDKELSQLSDLRSPNKVLAVVELPAGTPAAPAEGWILYLDGMQSPGNLGAVLRVADWFGIRQVVGGPGTADLFNGKTLQASMGAFLRIHYREAILDELLQEQPLPVYGADMKGENVFTAELPERGILVIGNEGQGIRPETGRLTERWLRIPAAGNSGTESLNAAVAAGILCAAITQRAG